MGNASRVYFSGPLAAYKDGLVSDLRGQRYTPLSSASLVRLMAHLSRWLSSKHLHVDDLTADRLDEFLRHRRRAGYTAFLTCRGLRPIVGYLNRVELLPVEKKKVPEQTPLDKLIGRYESYLVRERALSTGVVRQYQKTTRHFLSTVFKTQSPNLARLAAADVSAYIVREARASSVGYTKYKVCALRSFLRYLHVAGDITADLSAALPAVAGWRFVGLPRALTPEAVNRLLRACDRRTLIGCRDYAVLVLLVRLGLRAGEVAALTLDDIDWSRGELVVRGKGGRHDPLPLPQDVGEAVVAYLRRGRPRCPSRRLFLSSRAPYGDMTPSMAKYIVRAAGLRCGLPNLGSHRLRHTTATLMLRHGASLLEIGRVLRHRNMDTTAIYSKVDSDSLQTVCRPWPGAMP